MAKKQKLVATDGYGPKERAMVHKAVRQVFTWSAAYREVKKRCKNAEGFYVCEKKSCRKVVPTIAVDHIKAIGEVGGPNYIRRMFVNSKKLQGLCKACHGAKTRLERKAASTKKKQEHDWGF